MGRHKVHTDFYQRRRDERGDQHVNTQSRHAHAQNDADDRGEPEQDEQVAATELDQGKRQAKAETRQI